MPNKTPSTWLVPNIIMHFRSPFPKEGEGEVDSSTHMVNAKTWELLVIYVGSMRLEFPITEITLNIWSKHFIAFNAGDAENMK